MFFFCFCSVETIVIFIIHGKFLPCLANILLWDFCLRPLFLLSSLFSFLFLFYRILAKENKFSSTSHLEGHILRKRLGAHYKVTEYFWKTCVAVLLHLVFPSYQTMEMGSWGIVHTAFLKINNLYFYSSFKFTAKWSRKYKEFCIVSALPGLPPRLSYCQHASPRWYRKPSQHHSYVLWL